MPTNISSMQEHLKENGLKLEETDYIVGRAFDSKTESIKGDQKPTICLPVRIGHPMWSLKKSSYSGKEKVIQAL